MVTVFKEWTTPLVRVEEQSFDRDLHRFAVYSLDGVRLGYVTPADLDDMAVIANSLDGGGCPIAHGWEDGLGNTCSIDGWGA